jgi:hypothetical protein
MRHDNFSLQYVYLYIQKRAGVPYELPGVKLFYADTALMNGIKLLWEAVEKYKFSLNIGYYLVLISLCWTK